MKNLAIMKSVANFAGRDRYRLGQALAAAEFCYSEGLSQKEVAQRLKTSPASISRLLRLARDAGLVRFRFHRPSNLVLSSKLHKRLPSLRSVIVEGRSREQVANAAVDYFENKDRSGQIVVLDGGLTVADFVEALSFETFQDLQIMSIAADPPTYRQAASESALRMSAKYSTATLIRLPQFRGPFLDPLIHEAQRIGRQTRFVVLGIGPFRDGFSALEFTKHLGLDPSKVQSRHPKAVAAVGYSGIDCLGHHIPLHEVNKRLPKSLSFSEIQRLARQPECEVVLLAHSAEKAESVEFALRAQICNVLVVDEELADSLCRRIDEKKTSW